MGALYNEIDPFAAQWLRNLIAAGHIADGVVDERSIAGLDAADVAGPGQRHFFAGIAGWSLALRLAGIPDDADVWTGSCPCQGFSDAGRRLGFDDERHLWPAWFRLIAQCRPPVILGEQVASGLGRAWLDLVFADLEGAGYACAAADLPAAGIGAPHKRQRLFFVAYADSQSGRLLAAQRRPGPADAQTERRGEARQLADSDDARSQGRIVGGNGAGQRSTGTSGVDGGVANAETTRRGAGRLGGAHGRPTVEPDRHGDDLCDCGHSAERHDYGADDCDDCSCTYFLANTPRGRRSEGLDGGQAGSHPGPRPADGGWSDCAWIPCSDGVARPAEPGAHPLAHGVPGRVGLLRGYGNAIVPQVAAAFIRAALEAG